LTWEPVSGFEPLTCRLQEVLSPLGPWSHGIYASPAQPRSCWSAGLRDHNNNHAAVCREVPFGLWVPVGAPSAASTCGIFVGLAEPGRQPRGRRRTWHHASGGYGYGCCN